MTNLVQNIAQIKIPEGNSGEALDKLAQPHTKSPEAEDTTTLETYKRRALAKYSTRALVLEMVKLDSPMKKAYWNSWHCSNIILQDGKTLTTKYCNNRWCTVCNRIRTAKLIKGYLPELEKMDDPQFVTLTIPTMSGDKLKEAIEGMTKTFIKIKNLFYSRRTFQINGVRKIECTYNETTNEYHPHFHVVLDGKEVGEALIGEWLKRYPEAMRSGQDIRKADMNSMKELFKYATKLCTKDKVSREGEQVVMEVHPESLDTIFQAMYRKRTFQSMGWVKMVSEDVEEVDAQEVEDVEEATDVWTWEQEASDWVNSSGELLTGCNACMTHVLKVNTS